MTKRDPGPGTNNLCSTIPSKGHKRTSSASETLLAAVVKRHIRDRRLSVRSVEAKCGLSRGRLTNALNGRTEIRLHHLEAVAAFLGLPTFDLLQEAYGDIRDTEVVTVTLSEDDLVALLRQTLAESVDAVGEAAGAPVLSEPNP